MSKLETQYKNFKKENPESEITFEDWKNITLINMFKVINSTKDDDDDFGVWDVTSTEGLDEE
jgi:hypothetical protein